MPETTTWQGIPRREIPWYPTIHEDLCSACQSCVDFCASGVFGFDDVLGRAVVVQPYNCVVYCTGCVNACPSDAISFPKKEDVVALVKELRAKYNAEPDLVRLTNLPIR